MRKNYILFIALFAVIVSYSQTTRTYSTTGGTSWNTDANWELNAKPVTGDIVELTTVDSEADYAISISRLNITGATDIELNASSELTIDSQLSTSSIIFENSISGGSKTFTIKGDMHISNSNTGNSVMRNRTVTNTLNFDTGSTLTLESNATINNLGVLDVNGLVLKGASGRLAVSGAGTTNFNSDYGLSTSNMVFSGDGSTHNFNFGSSTVDTKSVFFNGGSDENDIRSYTVNINAVDAIHVSKIEARDYSNVLLNIDFNSSNIGALEIDEATVEIDLASGVTAEFDDSNGLWNTNAIIEITGIEYYGTANERYSNIRFGTTNTGISVSEVTQIVIIGGTEEMALNDEGYLVEAKDLEEIAENPTKTFTGDVDVLWSKDGNWDDAKPGSSDNVLLDSDVFTNSTMDADFTVTKLVATGVSNNTLYSNPSSGYVLTIDPNVDESADALENQLTGDRKFIVDAALVFENTLNSVRTMFIRNENSVAILEFSEDSSIQVDRFVSITNTGTLNLKGTITGTDGRLLFNSSGTTNFDSRLGLSTIEQLRFSSNNATYNFNGENSANVAPANSNMYFRFSTTRTNTVNLTAENSLQLDRMEFDSSSITNINLTANQSDIGKLQLDASAIINLNLDSNNCSFLDSSSEIWDVTAMIAITGFVQDEGVTPNTSNVRFGTDENGLSVTQLSQVTVNGEAASISSEGYIIRANSLSVANENTIDFAMYPNPVVDVLTITSEENIAKYEVLNLVGTTVVSVSTIENGLDVSNLTSGVYILRLTSANGISTAKFVKK